MCKGKKKQVRNTRLEIVGVQAQCWLLPSLASCHRHSITDYLSNAAVWAVKHLSGVLVNVCRACLDICLEASSRPVNWLEMELLYAPQTAQPIPPNDSRSK